MKRRVRERVVGVSVEDDGEDVDGVGRELIIVVVGWRGEVECDGEVCDVVTGLASGSVDDEIVLSDRSCLVLRGCGLAWQCANVFEKRVTCLELPLKHNTPPPFLIYSPYNPLLLHLLIHPPFPLPSLSIHRASSKHPLRVLPLAFIHLSLCVTSKRMFNPSILTLAADR
jgi:hypothetical protein